MPGGSTYGDSKVAAERALLGLEHGPAVTIVRPADVYGPGSRPWVVEPLGEIARGRLVLPAGGRGTFTPVHVDDVVRGCPGAGGSRRAGQRGKRSIGCTASVTATRLAPGVPAPMRR